MSESKTVEYFIDKLEKEPLSQEALVAVDGLRAAVLSYRTTVDDLQHELATLNQLAVTDSLTNLKNRRAFDEDLENWTHRLSEIEDRRESDHRYHVLLIIGDLDNFKLVNDVLGYEYGDRVLSIVAATLEESVRHSDTVYRLGGDEFAILAPVAPGQEEEAYAMILQRFHENLEILRSDSSSLSPLDKEAIQAVDASFAHGILEERMSSAQVAHINQTTMQNIKKAKEGKVSLR